MTDVHLNEAMAELARDSLTDVFTPDGDAVTIGSKYNRFTGKVKISGERHHDEWIDVIKLTAGRDLVRLYDETYPPGGYLIMTLGYWGRGRTIEEAKASLRKAGGKLNVKKVIYLFDDETRFFGVTGNGSIEYIGNSPTKVS